MVLDKFDNALLKLLQKNCLTPIRELADTVHLSMASVQRRIQKLRENRYILENVAVLNSEKMNQVITVIVEVRIKQTHMTDLEVLKESFSGPEVQQCYYVTGDADFMLVLLVPNMSHLQRICDKFFHNNENIQWFKTTVVLERVKATLNVPIA
ncbi:Lrp/AsnC family transcriptional regulator [Acinetobacter haemolyticus]|uniref:Lrp/AsnC family transcriptional regulator n=1 Tax=Acinetobacter haemolyticus TaxID=29430 RepID=UPI003F55B95C